MATLRALNNDIVFQFIDDVNTKGRFIEGMSSSGIILGSSDDDSARRPRWAKVVAIGPKCTSVEIGNEILIPALRWTLGATFEGAKYWKTRDNELVAKRDHHGGALHVLNSWVVFHREQDMVHVRQSGLFYVSKQETPKGHVAHVGQKCDAILGRSDIYYKSEGFIDLFTHRNREYAFIKDEDILAYEVKE
jgi:co-chaperonin GroES (HSP10)